MAVQRSWRATEIIGGDVKTSQGDSVGEIQELLIDLKSGNIVGVVISSGGFLGIADTLSTVPTSSLNFDANEGQITTHLTKDQLGKAPQFKSDAWPADRNEMMEQLKNFRNSIGGDISQPDNTAQNENDMKQEMVTPLDQGEGEADLKITKDIRMAVMDTDMSFNAKNVKIITNGGKVTLRGVVNSQSEKEKVVSIARHTAGDTAVSDQIKVKKD